MNHSPEPWRFEPDLFPDQSLQSGIKDAGGGIVLRAEHHPGQEVELDLSRIVACVNFCRDFSTQWLAEERERIVVCLDFLQRFSTDDLKALLADKRCSDAIQDISGAVDAVKGLCQ